MDAQYQALLEQRRAAGLSDETLPKYGKETSTNNAASSHPADIQKILDAQKKRN